MPHDDLTQGLRHCYPGCRAGTEPCQSPSACAASDALEKCAALDGLHSHQPREAQPGPHQPRISVCSHEHANARAPNNPAHVSAQAKVGAASLDLHCHPTQPDLVSFVEEGQLLG